MRALLAPALLLALVPLAGCLGGDGGDSGGLDLAPAEGSVPQVDAAALLADLRSFANTFPVRTDNEPTHLAARDWLANTYAGLGLTVWRQNFTTGLAQENVVGIQWGEDRSTWVVVGGHIDTYTRDCGVARQLNGNTPDPVPDAPASTCVTQPYSAGIYDDGSGTLMTLHLAKAFANRTLPFTVAYVGFDGEERGLEGSGNLSETLATGTTPWGPVTVRAMLDIDMFGLNCPGVDAAIHFDANSPELDAFLAGYVAEAHPECADTIKYQGITLGRSDYAHFFALGVPTGFFISDFEEWQLPANVPANAPALPPLPVGASIGYPFWHLADTWDTMVLMAGSEADVLSGFQVGADLASAVLWFMASDPSVTLTAEAAA